MAGVTDLQLCDPATPAEIDAHPEFVAERKLDGVRAVASEGRIKTRSGNDVTKRFPEIDPPEHHTFDGEIITADFTFESALRRVQTQDAFKIEMLADNSPARLVAFDALRINESDVRERPQAERRELLGPSIPEGAGIVPITTHDDAMALWEQAQANGWEGIILKDPDAPYQGKRTNAWLKIKDWCEQAFEVVETEETDNGGYVAYVEIGDDEPQKVAVNAEADRETVQPGAEIQVQFLERSDNDRLRKPSFRGVA